MLAIMQFITGLYAEKPDRIIKMPLSTIPNEQIKKSHCSYPDKEEIQVGYNLLSNY